MIHKYWSMMCFLKMACLCCENDSLLMELRTRCHRSASNSFLFLSLCLPSPSSLFNVRHSEPWHRARLGGTDCLARETWCARRWGGYLRDITPLQLGWVLIMGLLDLDWHMKAVGSQVDFVIPQWPAGVDCLEFCSDCFVICLSLSLFSCYVCFCWRLYM